jgi:hypothetical protein
VKGAEGSVYASSITRPEEGEGADMVGASGVQQERPVPGPSCGEGILGAEFIGVSLEQQSSWDMGSFEEGEVLDADSRGVSVEQQSSEPMTLSRFFSGTGLVGRSQCFCENIGMFMNAV